MNEPCFLCGATAIRREMITVGRASGTLSIGTTRDAPHSTTVRELKPLCAGCIAQREEEGRQLLAGAKVGLAIGGTMFAASVLIPVALCLGSALVLGVIAWFAQQH